MPQLPIAALLLLAPIETPSDTATTQVVVRRADAQARDPRAVRRLYLRLSDAALQACGAGPESLRELRIATRASRCWNDAMLATLRQIGNPALDAAFKAREQ